MGTDITSTKSEDHVDSSSWTRVILNRKCPWTSADELIKHWNAKGFVVEREDQDKIYMRRGATTDSVVKQRALAYRDELQALQARKVCIEAELDIIQKSCKHPEKIKCGVMHQEVQYACPDCLRTWWDD